MKSLFIIIFLFSFLISAENLGHKNLNKDIQKVRESTILFKLKDNVTASQLKSFNSLINKNTIIEKRELKGLKIKVVKVKNIKGKEYKFSKMLEDTKAVVFAEPDVLIPHALSPNDEFYYLQWHHGTINSQTAWNSSVGSNLIKVCVLDTGVDTDHPDLLPNILLPGFNAYLDVSGNVEDLYGHGSGTAGVIGAVGNNSFGVSGVNWNIKIMPVQISQGTITSSAYISDMALGIRWCADNGAKVANLSYGGAQYSTISDAASYLKEKGGLLFMSAGNSGTFHNSISFPDFSSFIVVGSTSQNDEKSSFSEYGPYIDIVAPGEDIATTYLDASYVYYSGTSFSSPMAAGVAALALSVNPTLTVDELEDVMFSSTVDLGVVGEDDLYGNGRIDASLAIDLALNYGENNAPIALISSNISSGIVPLDVAFSSNGSSDIEDGTNITYFWDFGDGNTSILANPNHQYTSVGTFEVSLIVTDTESLSSQASNLSIEVLDNIATLEVPYINSTIVDEEFNSVTINWEHNLVNTSGFVIERAKKQRGKYNFSIQSNIGLINTYIDENVDSGSYRYRMFALSNDEEISSSNYSNQVSVNVETSLPSEPETPIVTTPTLNSETPDNGFNVKLTWTTCTDCTYTLERAVKGRGKASFNEVEGLINTNLSSASFNESTGTYIYRVYSILNNNTSGYSNTITKKIQ